MTLAFVCDIAAPASLLPARSPLSPARVLKRHWDGLLPVRPERIAALMKVTLVGRGGSGDSAYPYCGYLSMHAGRPRIEFNVNDSILRRRFTVAHELGHYALCHSDPPRDPPSNFGVAVPDANERAANQFAAELLMPAQAVVTMISLGLRCVDDLARTFMVSKVAMGYRLCDLSHRS